MSVYVGIDVSKATLDVALRQQSKSQYFQVPNHRQGFQDLHKQLQASGEIAVVALEASGRYGEALAHFLVEQG